MKRVIMLAMVAFMTLAMSQKTYAIEDPNPKGTVAIGAHVGFLPGIGFLAHSKGHESDHCKHNNSFHF